MECYIAAILHHLVDGSVTWIDTEADDISVGEIQEIGSAAIAA